MYNIHGDIINIENFVINNENINNENIKMGRNKFSNNIRKIYYINMDKSVKRRKHIEKRMKKYLYNFNQ